ncbi:unnamed protein product, partial [Ixodes pacificus]
MSFSRMASGATTEDKLTRRYPKFAPKTAIIGDSQTKYLFNHFDPMQKGTPALITWRGAGILDILRELKNLPRSVTTMVFHVGTNDLASHGGEETLRRYRSLVEYTRRERPEVRRIYVSLVLPRHISRRSFRPNQGFVLWFNNQARLFNQSVRNLCRRSQTVFYVDHGFEDLPPRRFLAADGVHPNFLGVAVIAEHLRGILPREAAPSPPSWSAIPSSDTGP